MKRFTILIVLLLSLFGIFDLFSPGYYSSHDGTGHVIRMEEFYKSIISGQIPVRWSQGLYWGYGYPFFNFNYPSIYYLGVPLMAAGLSATNAMKAETIGFFLLSGVLMYLYLRTKTKPIFALLGTVLYLYAPYRMSNIYVRGSVAEAMAFIFPPLLLWGAEALTAKSFKHIFWVSLVIGLMGISHNISMLLLSAFFFGYLLVLSIANKTIRPLITGSLAYLLGVLMAAFFLVPALYEKRWTFLDLTIARDYPDHFVFPQQFFDPRWGFGGSGPGLNDGMSLSLGIIHLILAAVVIKFIPRNPLIIFSYLIVAVSVFFMLPVSKIFWDNLPLLPFVQFPWRFTMLTVPALAIIGCLGISKLKPVLVAVLIGITIFGANYMWHRNQTEYVAPITGDAIEGSTTWAHEQATRWLVPKPDRIPSDKIENAKYQINLWKTNEHAYTIFADKNTTITENTMYYPGWKVFVDEAETKIDYANGKINYPVTAGTHKIKTVFTETVLRQAANIMSLVTLVTVVLGLLFSYVVPKIFSKH